MEEDRNLEEVNREQRQSMVEGCSLSVVLYKQELVGPVDDEEVQEPNEVEDWHATRVGHDGPERCEVLGIDEVCFNLWPSVEGIEI